MPFALIPFLLLAIPVAEIGAFIVIGGKIGVLPTLLMILVTAIFGSLLLRHQGLGLINTIRSEMEAGRVPGKAMGEGAMILLAGILLLTPGFITDFLGFLLFVPPIRDTIWRVLSSRITVVGPGGFEPFRQAEAGYDSSSTARNSGDGGKGPVIDLDEEDFKSRPKDKDGESGNPGNSPWSKLH